MSARDDLMVLYEQVDSQSLPCDACGRCCRFDAMGFELWATRLEVDTMVALGGRPAAEVSPSRCPYQDGVGRCLNRRGRVLGCRLYCCGSERAAESERCERAMAALRDLHRRHGVPWEYGRVTEMLLKY